MTDLASTSSREKVVVVGGGVIGAMCAWFLAKAGHQVTVVDRGRFGAACSHGNCGYVCPSHMLPLAQPGAVRKGLAAILRPNSPLCIRLRYSPSLWNWLMHFSRRCNQKHMLESGLGRHQLLQSSLSLFKQLISEDEIDCEWTENGLLFVFATKEHFESYETTNRLIRENFGVESQPLDSTELTEKEPALKSDLGGAWYYADDCHLRPEKLMLSLRASLEIANASIVENFDVCKFFTSGNGVCRAIGNDQNEQIEADVFVVATGALSPILNRQLGCNLPIQPGKGYSITMPHPRLVPRIPMIFEEHRVAITPMKTKYRIGSTMEFAGYDTTINPSRLDLLKRSAELYLHEPYCQPIEEKWYGWRPMTWDGNPIIDRCPIMNNVWIAAGHNMLGVSMSTGTGKLIRELIDQEQPHIDPIHYKLSRFY